MPVSYETQESLIRHILKYPGKESIHKVLSFLNAQTSQNWRLFEATDDSQTFLASHPPFTTIQLEPKQVAGLLKRWQEQAYEQLMQSFGWVIPLESAQQTGRLLGLLVSPAMPQESAIPHCLLGETLLCQQLAHTRLMALAEPEQVEQELLRWLTTGEPMLDEATVKRYARYLQVDLQREHLIALFSFNSPEKMHYRHFANQIAHHFPGSLISFQSHLLVWLDLAMASVQEALFWFQQAAAEMSEQGIALFGGLSSESTQAPCLAAYQEAVQVWQEARTHETGGVLTAQHLGLRRFVAWSPAVQSDPHYQFIDKIATMDTKGIYFPVLRAFLLKHNVAQAAQSIGAPENTVRSRMHVIEQIAHDFHISLDTPHLLNLSLALLLYEQTMTGISPFPR